MWPICPIAGPNLLQWLVRAAVQDNETSVLWWLISVCDAEAWTPGAGEASGLGHSESHPKFRNLIVRYAGWLLSSTATALQVFGCDGPQKGQAKLATLVCGRHASSPASNHAAHAVLGTAAQVGGAPDSAADRDGGGRRHAAVPAAVGGGAVVVVDGQRRQLAARGPRPTNHDAVP